MGVNMWSKAFTLIPTLIGPSLYLSQTTLFMIFQCLSSRALSHHQSHSSTVHKSAHLLTAGNFPSRVKWITRFTTQSNWLLPIIAIQLHSLYNYYLPYFLKPEILHPSVYSLLPLSPLNSLLVKVLTVAPLLHTRSCQCPIHQWYSFYCQPISRWFSSKIPFWRLFFWVIPGTNYCRLYSPRKQMRKRRSSCRKFSRPCYWG